MKPAVVLIFGSACTLEPRHEAVVTTTAIAPASASAIARPSGCREDIPDCVAACALRETSRTSYLDWFDRRCAAVMLGKNPDHVVGTTAPNAPDLLDTR